jgi:8-oxo-dGTP pyrophosphatase MutT (NUDIX family)
VTELQKSWKTLSSRYVIKDRWISLRADRCLTERNVELDPYYVIEAPDFVHAVVLDDEDRLVMVRQYRHAAATMSLELPGGLVDEQDESILSAAARELAEETGFQARNIELLCSLPFAPGRFNNRLHFVYGSGARQVAPQSLDITEDIEVVLVPIAAALDLALNGGIVQSTHIAGLLLTMVRKRPELLRR